MYMYQHSSKAGLDVSLHETATQYHITLRVFFLFDLHLDIVFRHFEIAIILIASRVNKPVSYDKHHNASQTSKVSS